MPRQRNEPIEDIGIYPNWYRKLSFVIVQKYTLYSSGTATTLSTIARLLNVVHGLKGKWVADLDWGGVRFILDKEEEHAKD